MARTAASLIDGQSANAVLRMVQDDYEAARLTRENLEDRKLEGLKTYRAYRDDLDAPGPFGWSKMRIPIGFWTTETIVPRILTQLARPLVKPCNLEAVPYIQAKTLRLERQVELARPMDQLVMALKETSILGNGPVKVTWNPQHRRAEVRAISWWYFWLSAEATDYRTAECLFHVTWHTKRQLMRLHRLRDENDQPLYVGLDEVWDDAGARDTADRTWTERREIAGMGPVAGDRVHDSVPLLECWYDDGTRVVLGGVGFRKLVHARVTPYRDQYGDPLRPFAVFSNTPDLGLPYAIGDMEMVQDYQAEISTIRNQHVDQVTANINAPVAYDEKVSASVVKRAFAQPGGLLPVPGDVARAVARIAPGQVSQDPVQLTEMVLSEVQRVTGLSDYAAGQTSGLGLANNTATGAQIAVGEGNKRWEFKQRLLEQTMTEVYRIVDAHDRRFLALDVPVPLLGRDTPVTEAEGMTVTPDGSMAVVTAAVNGWDLDSGAATMAATPPYYDIEIERGSAAPPSQRERAQNVMAFMGLLGQVPMLAGMLDMQQLAREAIVAFGFSPDKLMVPPGAAGVDQPVGPPVPLSPEEEAAVHAGADPASVAAAPAAGAGPAGPEGAPPTPEGPAGPPAPVAAPQVGPIILNVEPGAVVLQSSPVTVDTGDKHLHEHAAPTAQPVAKQVVYDENDRPIALIPITAGDTTTAAGMVDEGTLVDEEEGLDG